MTENFYTLITGAGDGFGKALAMECAYRKMNLVLVSLPDPNLIVLAATIKENYNVDVVVIEKDLSIEENCISVYNEVEALNLPLNMLINNVGLGGTLFFNEGNIDFYQKQVRLNVLATTMLTHLFLKALKRNGPSHILCVGSLCSFFYLIKKQVYGATKSYIYFFSKSLRRELAPDNINVSVICPGPMNTNPSITKMNLDNSWFTRIATMEPEEVAYIAMNGVLNRKEVIIPGKINKLYLILNSIFPSPLKKLITNHQIRSIKQPSFVVIKNTSIIED